MSGRLRLLGVTQDAGGKWGALYDGAGDHFDVVGVLRPQAPRSVQIRAIARNLKHCLQVRRPDPAWSVAMFDARTADVDRLLRERGPDHDVILQAQTLFGPGGAARHAPYVVYTDSTHALNQRYRYEGDPTPGRRGVRLQERERGVVRAAAHVFTMSEFARASMVEDYGCDPAAVTAVGAGINLDALPRPAAPDRPRAIFVGIDFDRKGGNDVLAAWPAVTAAVPGAELVIVGPRPGAAIAGVRWAGRVEDRAELSALYASASVFVLPTRWDPWGLVYHEAMAHGLPCIGPDAFAVPEIIADGETGRLVPPRSPDAIAAALIELLSDPTAAERMGAEAQRRVRAAGTWSSVVGRMAPAITQIAGARAA
ncbi:MAG: alpha-maltose-phosphate synthase [Solirubrobacteraceae bacterium]|nr:alpha-maltose-phosphate synthase [Solirubrobacteraceae bacterium]